MNPRLSVAVIGRGILGLSCARRLLEAGFRVTIFGKKALPYCASRAAAGVFTIKGLLLPQSDHFATKLEGHRRLKNVIGHCEAQTGRTIPHIFDGVYELFSDEGEYRHLNNRIYHRQFIGCYSVSTLHREALEKKGKLFEGLIQRKKRSNGEPGVAGALFYRQDGWFDPRALLEVLEELCCQLGGILRDEGHVDEVKPCSDSARLRVAVASSVEEFDEVVLACGAYTNDLLIRSGLKPLDLVQVPGQTLIAEATGQTGEAAEQIVLKAGTFSFVQYQGRIFAGSTTLSALTEAQQLNGEKEILAKIQGLTGLKPIDLKENLEFLAASRVCPRKGRDPFFEVRSFYGKNEEIDFLQKNQGVFILAGFHRSGFSLADSYAEKVCEWMEKRARGFHLN